MIFAAILLGAWSLWQSDIEAAILAAALIVARSIRGPSQFWQKRIEAVRAARADDVRS